MITRATTAAAAAAPPSRGGAAEHSGGRALGGKVLDRVALLSCYLRRHGRGASHQQGDAVLRGFDQALTACCRIKPVANQAVV